MPIPDWAWAPDIRAEQRDGAGAIEFAGDGVPARVTATHRDP